MTRLSKDTYLGQIKDRYRISKQALTFCMVHGLTTLHKLEQHYSQHKGFSDSRRNNKEVNHELKKLLSRFKAQEAKDSAPVPASQHPPINAAQLKKYLDVVKDKAKTNKPAPVAALPQRSVNEAQLQKFLKAQEDKAKGENPAPVEAFQEAPVSEASQLHGYLNELEGENPLSAKAFVFCMLHAFHSVAKLQAYYGEHGSFRALQSYDEDIERELVSVMRHHRLKAQESGVPALSRIDKSVEKKPINPFVIVKPPASTTEVADYFLGKLPGNARLASKSLSFCMLNGLTTLNRVLKEFKAYNGFNPDRIPNGKIRHELLVLLEKYKMIQIAVTPTPSANLMTRAPMEEAITITPPEPAPVIAYNADSITDDNEAATNDVFSIIDDTDLTTRNVPSIINNVELNKAAINLVSDASLLSDFQQSIFKLFVEHHLSQLSTRACNALSNEFGRNATDSLLKMIIGDVYDFSKLPNVGSNTLRELQDFKKKSKKNFEEIQIKPNEKLRQQYHLMILNRCFSGFQAELAAVTSNIFDSQGKLYLFALIDALVDMGIPYKRTERAVFQLLYYSNKKPTIVEETEKVLTNDRIRKVRPKLAEEMKDNFSFVSYLNPDFISDNEIEGALHVIDQDRLDWYTRKEQANFKVHFYGIILGLLMKDKYAVVGDNEVIGGGKKTIRANRFRNCYLIDKNIAATFDFDQMLENAVDKKEERIEQTYTIYFDGYLLEFFQNSDQQYFDEVRSISEELLKRELDMFVDAEGYLHFERNTRILMHEYAQEILRESNRLMSVTQILYALQAKYPGQEFLEASIRTGLQRAEELFIYVGRTNNYGLREWEHMHENLKPGTMRDIVEEYLRQFDEPKHISEIMEYLLQYRNTTSSNLLAHLRIEENKRFVFLKNALIGLAEKTYATTEVQPETNDAEPMSRADLVKFNNQSVEDVVDYYTTEYGYNRVYIKFLLEVKNKNGEIQIVDNKIIIP